MNTDGKEALMIYFGLDLGQKHDPSALAAVELDEEVRAWAEPVYYGLNVRYLERFALGTPFGRVVDRVEEIVEHPLVMGKCHLTVDATGLGSPVMEMIRNRGMKCGLTAVTITGGTKARKNGIDAHVPKVDLLMGMQLLLEKGELRIAKGMKDTGCLVKELICMRMKGSSEGAHDDLAIAVALGCWSARQGTSACGIHRIPGM